MKTYHVIVRGFWQQTVEVHAENKEKALEQAMYGNGKEISKLDTGLLDEASNFDIEEV